MAHQLEVWKNDFGNAYTDRNVVDWKVRFPAFQHMLDGLSIERVLEVGCNRGHNLVTLIEVLGEDADLIGIEPNPYARGLARTVSEQIGVLKGHIFDLPFKDGYFDLVFTANVLIHIPLADLPNALNEIYRVSQRFILAIEYFSEEETVIHYHGHDDLLWKRDFLKHYQSQFPDLRLVRSGYWGPEDGFDRSHWWLFEKHAG